jgi:hypothetical protein
MPLHPSEVFFPELIESKYDIQLLRIPENKGREGRTSDYEYIQAEKRVFVCERRRFEDVPISEDTGFKRLYSQGKLIGWGKKDNATRRIRDAIIDKHGQLFKYAEPRILALMNYSPIMGFDNLVETYRGYRDLPETNGSVFRDSYASWASEGKIKFIKEQIDLYMWIDMPFNKDKAHLEWKIDFLETNEAGKSIKNNYFKTSC